MNENQEHDSTEPQRGDAVTPASPQGDEAPQAPVSSPADPGASPADTSPAAAPADAQPQPQPAAAYAAPAPAGSIYDVPPARPRATEPGAAFGPAAAGTDSGSGAGRNSGRRRLVVPVVAALAVGALLGGASGAGIALLVDNDNTRVVSESGSGTNITVNRGEDATPVTAVAAKASPSVVTISVSGTSSAGTGSGIVLSEDGYILTNTHVVTLDGSVADAQVSVTTSDGRIFSATVVGTDPIVDLAVIKLDDASGLTPMEFADSESLNVGDSAVAIGAPLGLSGTVTDGIISSLNRSITVASSAVPDSTQDQATPGQGGGSPYDFWNFDVPGENQQQQQQTGTISIPVIQTDAAINPGNSGGALLNSEGELIGVNVAIASADSSSSSASGNIGVGFAIPANLAKRVADEIIDSGAATHGLLGASVGDATSVDPKTTVAGAYIQEVSDGGAAAQAGLRKGDIITQFNGVTVTSSTDLTAQVRYLAAGADADLVYFRDGQSYEASVTLGELSL